jgi:AcrR family transcriptional regulator
MADKQRARRGESRKEPGTREKLIAAAEAILVEEGSGAISTRHIADRAGVNQALVHYHFESVENLMLEVLRGTSVRAMEVVQGRYAGERDFVDKWLADLDPTFQRADLFGPKSWLEIMGIVVNDDNLMEVYRKDFVDPNYAIMRGAVEESLARSGITDQAAIEVIASYALMIRAGVFITYLLGRNPGEEKAIELAARFLREYIASLTPGGAAPAGQAPAKSGPTAGD